jgi:hypothetical protein
MCQSHDKDVASCQACTSEDAVGDVMRHEGDEASIADSMFSL